jgi:hypothetical protein
MSTNIIRISNSCHTCKVNLTGKQYVTCKQCKYKYCSRTRCINKLNGTTWNDIQQKFESGQLCPHCIHLDDPTIPCTNTNCQHKGKRKRPNVLLPQHKHTPPPPAVTIVQSPPLLPSKSMLPPRHPRSVSIDPSPSPPPPSYRTIPTESYNINFELDKILDQLIVLNTVQLYLFTVQHPLLMYTAIPQLIQQYHISGYSMLTSITPTLLSTTPNLSTDLADNTMYIISQLIARQHYRATCPPINNNDVNVDQYNTFCTLLNQMVSPSIIQSNIPPLPYYQSQYTIPSHVVRPPMQIPYTLPTSTPSHQPLQPLPTPLDQHLYPHTYPSHSPL